MSSRRTLGLKIALFAALSGPLGLLAPARAADSTGARVLPVDQAPKDPSFLAFRDRLKEAVKLRNTDGLLAALDTEVLLSFGGENGVKAFRERWKLNRDPEKSDVWKELETLLALGGAWMPDAHGKLSTFCAPYVYTQMPEDESENPALAAILGKDVALRSAPKDNGGVIRRLSYNRVRVLEGEGEYRWRKVQTLDKLEGFVLSTEVRSAGDTRACFDKKAGAWKMTSLVSGD